MIVEQAIFGIINGRGHGLISSTIDKRLLENIRADFLSTINAHSAWQPYYGQIPTNGCKTPQLYCYKSILYK